MHIVEVRILLEERMGLKVADGFFADCVDAFFKGHVGPAALGSHAVLGLYTPFEHVLGHELKYPGHPCWPCSEAISLGAFFHQRNGLGEIIRECLRDFRNRTAPLPVRIGVWIYTKFLDLKKSCIAPETTDLTLNTALNVFVRTRRCGIGLKSSSVWRFF